MMTKNNPDPSRVRVRRAEFLRRGALLPLLAGAAALASCASSRIPLVQGLSVSEAQTMTCAELDQELVRAADVRHRIGESESIDWSTFAGIIETFLPSTDRQRVRAEAALDSRVADIQRARAQKGCESDEVDPPPSDH